MKPFGADLRHIPSLDGIRALSFGIVFISHALAYSPLPQLFPGMFGVTVFFFLSGFLITTLMVQEYGVTGTVSLSNFYLRRGLRLLPPLYIWLIIVVILYELGIFQGTLSAKALLAYAFYAGNYYLAFTPFEATPFGTRPLWSLAVEEHFYLLFPLLFIFLMRHARRQWRVPVLVSICCAVLLWRVAVWAVWGDQAYIEHATDTRMDALLFGCALALSQRNPWLASKTQMRIVPEIVTILLCVSALVGSLLYRSAWFRDTIGYTLEYCALVPLFWLAIQRSETWIFRWLNGRVLTYIGAVSYVLYLVHDGFLLLCHRLLPDTSWIVVSLIALAASVVFAETMRRYVENPLAKLRRKLHRASIAAPARPSAGTQVGSLSASTRASAE